ncbi:MAG: hypothetical protein K9W44_07700 [Candidatus Lokiarchaeota archaeon]|nr:hypothetical protein [Candidatus Harpocratesius repetitus]
MIEPKICENCGAEVSADDIYCAFCGANLKIQKKNWESQKFPDIPVDLQLNKNSIQEYKNLTRQIEQLQKVDSSYAEHKKYCQILQDQLRIAQKNYENLHLTTQKELKDVEKLKNLSLKSILASIRGDREDKIKKEELEYYTALNREQAAKNDLDELQKRLNIAQSELENLAKLVKKKQNLEKSLVILIDKICEGVKDPIEDKLEIELQNLLQQQNPLEIHRNQLRNALSHLNNAEFHYSNALESIRKALRASDWDTFFSGGYFADSIKHSNIADARDADIRARRSIQLAYKIIPNMPPIPSAKIEDISIFWDVFFDNIFSDLNAREKIVRSRESLMDAYHGVKSAKNWVNNELQKINSQFKELHEKIKHTRDELTKRRRVLIEQAIQT